MTFKDYPNILFTFSKISDGNMTVLRGNKNQTLKNRKRFLEKIRVDPKRTFLMNLGHTTHIKTISEKDLKDGNINNADFSRKDTIFDGVVTSDKGIFIFMVVGDCLPIAFYDPKRSIICLIHASRHNLAKGIIGKTCNKLAKQFGVISSNLLVEIGPSIGPCCYHKKIKASERIDDSTLKPYMFKTEDGEDGIDLWKLAEDQLQKIGVLRENINNPKICTYHRGQYFSHRKFVEEGLELDSRFAVILGMKNG